MNCQHCHQPLEAGAAFCGNCGQPVNPPTAQAAPVPPNGSPIAQVMQSQSAALVAAPAAGPVVAVGGGVGPGAAGIPGYALAIPSQHNGDIKALLSLLLGIASIVGTLFMILIGLGLGLAGIVMGTMSRSSSKRGLSTAGLVVSSLAVAANLGFWAWAVNHVEKTRQATAASHNITSPAVSTASLSTPCYSLGFVDKLNVANDSNSCDMNAYNGPSLQSSSNVYKVIATPSQASAGTLAAIAKPAIERDIQTNAASFSINNEQSTQFAGSPAYIVNASDGANSAALVEGAVYHQSGNGDSIFILVHATTGTSTDLSTLEAQWQWK